MASDTNSSRYHDHCSIIPKVVPYPKRPIDERTERLLNVPIELLSKPRSGLDQERYGQSSYVTVPPCDDKGVTSDSREQSKCRDGQEDILASSDSPRPRYSDVDL
jgi:hypothetical protein